MRCRPFVSVLGAVVMTFPANTAATAQDESRYSDWQQPGGDGAPAARAGGKEMKALLDRLETLVEDAREARAADPVFLRDLERLIRRHRWPWQKRVMEADFGGVNLGARWRTHGGTADVGRAGLRLAPGAPEDGMAARKAGEDKADKKDDSARQAALAVVESLIKKKMGKKDGDKEEKAEKKEPAAPAMVSANVAIPNAFAVHITVGAADGGGRFAVGVYQGQGREALDSGYRLAYTPDSAPVVELLRQGRHGSAVVDAGGKPAEAGGTAERRLVWTRSRKGTMSVRVDGEEVLRVRDRGFRDPFDGVMLRAENQPFTVSALRIDGAP